MFEFEVEGDHVLESCFYLLPNQLVYGGLAGRREDSLLTKFVEERAVLKGREQEESQLFQELVVTQK